MVAVTIDIDIKGAEKILRDAAAKQVPFALANTLNQLAFTAARKELPDKANSIFEGGATAWTKRGFRYKKTNKRLLSALVYVDGDTHGYLTYQVHGGVRTPIKRKILSPTSNLKTNKYGNITKGRREKLFSDGRYFVGTPKGTTAGVGVWERYRGNRKIRKVANLSDRAAYQRKFPMRAIVVRVVKANAIPFFRTHLRRALATAK